MMQCACVRAASRNSDYGCFHAGYERTGSCAHHARDAPGTKVLLLTLHSSSEFVRSAFKAGARGYVLKSDAENELIRALNVVVGEGTYVAQ